MNSQRSTSIGIALIMGVLFTWLFYTSSQQHKPTSESAATAKDSATVAAAGTNAVVKADSTNIQTSAAFPLRDENFALTKRIETPLFTADVSGRGATIRNFVLKHFKKHNSTQLDLVNKDPYNGGDVNLKFVAADGKTVDTKDLGFTFDPAGVTLGEKDSISFRAVYTMDSARSIEKIFHFNGDQYLIGIDYRLKGLQTAVSGYYYSAVIENLLPYAEQNATEESASARGFIGVKGSVEDIDASSPDEPQKKTMNGDVDFVGSRSFYFVQSLIAGSPRPAAAEINGTAIPYRDATYESYQTGINLPINRNVPEEVISLKYYLGPLDYDQLNQLNVGLDQTMDFGWSFVVRPISIHLMLPLFMWLHSFITNWGIVIIVFSILIKLITIPLSTGQMKSMQKMQVLQPKIAEIREKHKDDPSKLNAEMLKVYRTYGVNPAGGCLPMLLQMPILFALYAVLRNVVHLRQAEFVGWINDLSVPDALIHFGTSVPLLGEQLSGLTLLLGATMFIQQYFTITDPRQKMMVYLMPVIFTFMFNSLPSGVALYYLMFNIFGIIQQLYVTKIAAKPTLESMKVDPKKQKGGGLMARLQDLEQQQRQTRQEQMGGNTPQKKKKK